MTDVEHALKPFDPRVAFCPACGYSLQGLGEGARCPECGREPGKGELVLYGEGYGGNAIARRVLWWFALVNFVMQAHFIASFWSTARWFHLLTATASVGVWTTMLVALSRRSSLPQPVQMVLSENGVVLRRGNGPLRVLPWQKIREVRIALRDVREYVVRIVMVSGLFKARKWVMVKLSNEEAERLAGEIRALSKGKVLVTVARIS